MPHKPHNAQDCIAHVRAVLPAKVKRAVTWSDLPSPEPPQGPPQGPSKKRKPPAATQGESAVAIEALLPPAKQRKLLEQLVKLRQACCHPQVGAGGVRALEASARPMSMDEVLEYMITQATTEAEEEQRKACVLCGMMCAADVLVVVIVDHAMMGR